MTAPEHPELTQLRKRVADLERRELVAQAQRIAPGVVIPEDATDAEIRARAVSAAHGVQAIDGCSEDEVRGAFRALVHLRGADPVSRPPRTPRDARH